MTHKIMIALVAAAAALLVPTALHAKSKARPSNGAGTSNNSALTKQQVGDARHLGAKVGEGLAKAAPKWLW